MVQDTLVQDTLVRDAIFEKNTQVQDTILCFVTLTFESLWFKDFAARRTSLHDWHRWRLANLAAGLKLLPGGDRCKSDIAA